MDYTFNSPSLSSTGHYYVSVNRYTFFLGTRQVLEQDEDFIIVGDVSGLITLLQKRLPFMSRTKLLCSRGLESPRGLKETLSTNCVLLGQVVALENV